MALRSPSKGRRTRRLVVPGSEPIDEKVRWALMRRLIEVLGEEEAETLMDSLPPVVWSQLATKDDLGALEKRLMSTMDTKFTEFKSEIRNEFTEFKSEIRNEFTDFKSEIRGDLGAMKGELTAMEGKWALQLARATRTMVLSFVGVAVAMPPWWPWPKPASSPPEPATLCQRPPC